ncbi:MAG UNVERIFIED_CONTAM: hypothetical protein LVT10_02810 [Anaerolineae bacterium]|jgi:hypothetical protein
MKIKTTTAFRAYPTASRERPNEGKSFMVKALSKDGSVSRMAPTASNWQARRLRQTQRDAERPPRAAWRR